MKNMAPLITALMMLAAGHPEADADCFSVQYENEKTSAQLSLPEAWSNLLAKGPTMVSVRESFYGVKSGQVYGTREVLGPPFSLGLKGTSRWAVVCRCECGAVSTILCSAISNGGRCQKCFAGRHRESHTRLHNIWIGMKNRCSNPNNGSYDRYGGRGLAVCQEWIDSYESFRDWSLANGYEDNLEIDRKNNDLGYSPGNCRWVTRTVNCNNRRASRHLTAFGETKTLADWCKDERCVVPDGCLAERLKLGWEVEVALTKPSQKKARA